MKNRNLKDCFLTGVLGITIGSLLNLTLKELDATHKLIFIALVFLLALLIAIIYTSDLNKRLDKAYQKGIYKGVEWKFSLPIHANCRHTAKPYKRKKE